MTFFDEPEVFWILFARVLLCCIILRVGYMIVQFDATPAASLQTIINQNIIELVVTTISFGVFGRSIIFISKEEETIPPDVDDFFDIEDKKNNIVASTIYVWTAVVSATTIFTTATAGRIHTVGHVILTAAIAGFIHPLAMRWTWSSDSFMKDAVFLDYNVTYLDCGSFSHVHLLAGTAALFTGAFSARYNLPQKYISPSILTPAQINSGYFLVLLGTIGLTIPLASSQTDTQTTTLFPVSYDSLVDNNVVAAAGGYAVSTLFQFVFVQAKDRSVIQDLQSALAGMVTVSSAIYLFTPLTSLVFGVIGGLTFVVVLRVLTASHVEDHCKVVTTHMVCGLVGSLYPKKMTEMSLVAGRESLVNFMWEVVCNLGLHAMFNVSMVAVLVTLDRLGYVKGPKGKLSRRLHRRNGGLVERDEEFGGTYPRQAKRWKKLGKKY